MVVVVVEQASGEQGDEQGGASRRVCVACGVAHPGGDFRTHRGPGRAVVSATCWLCEVMDGQRLREAEYRAGARRRPDEYHGDRLDGDWWCDPANPALHWREGGRRDNIHDEPVRFEDEIDPDGWDGAADPPTKRRKGKLRDSDRALHNHKQAVYRGAEGRERVTPWRPDLPPYTDRFEIARLRGGRERPAYSQPHVSVEGTVAYIAGQAGDDVEDDEAWANALDSIVARPVWLARGDETLRWGGAAGLPSTGDAPSAERIVRMADAEPDAMQALHEAMTTGKARDRYQRIDRALLAVEKRCSLEVTERALDEVLQHFPDFQRWAYARQAGYGRRGRKADSHADSDTDSDARAS